MKNIALVLSMMICIKVSAQITYEHSYPGPNSPSWSRLTIINLGSYEYKYYYFDYSTNEIKLFNLDHTPFFTCSPPFNLIDEGNYTVGYITKSLFDCDSSCKLPRKSDSLKVDRISLILKPKLSNEKIKI